MGIVQAEKHFKPGEIIMRQGDPGDCAYFIQSGRVAISVLKSSGELLDMGTRGSGNIIGEMAIVDNQPRSATVRAMEECTVLEVSQEDFSRSVSGANPIVQLITRVILARYRDILRRSELLSDYSEEWLLERQERDFAEQSKVVDAIRMANEFKVAIGHDQLRLLYQPIFDLSSGRIAGFEALMRWQHPIRGLMPPSDFIPMAEDSGLIVEASRWALRQACLTLGRMDEKLESFERPFMSVNFAGPDFEDASFVENFEEILRETDTDPARIHLEIVERILIRETMDVCRILSRFREMGVGVAVDDFGTGYSSLSYLHRYPINTLKIDQSFIRNMCQDEMSMRLVTSVLSLSENMGMKTVAEGVEGRLEARLLRQLKCDMAQGYYFAYPLAEDEALELLLRVNGEQGEGSAQ